MAVTLLAVWPICAQSSLYVYFEDDFESGDFNSPTAELGSPSWNVGASQTGFEISVQTNVVLSGDYSALISDQTTAHRGTLLSIHGTTPGDQLVDVSFSLRLENTDNISARLLLQHVAGSTFTDIIDVRWLHTDYFQYNTSGGVWTNVEQYSTNQTYNYRILLDEANSTYSVWIDGSEVLTDAATRNPSTSGINRFRLASGMVNASRGDIYLDNVKIETIPEPSALALLGLGSMLLALIRRRFSLAAR